MSFSFYIARRFSQIRQQNRNILLSFISISSLIGVAIGVMVIIIGLSTMNGFERELQHRVLSVIPHAEMSSRQNRLTEWPEIKAQVAKNKNVVSVSPYVNYQVLAENGNNLKGVAIQGVDQNDVTIKAHYASYIDPEEWRGFTAKEDKIILGRGLAKTLNVAVGDWFTILIPDISSTMQLKAPERKQMQVQGIIDLAGQIDHHLALVPLSDAQTYFHMGDAVTGLSLRFNDVLNAERLSNLIAYTLPPQMYIKSWTSTYGFMYRDIQMIRTILYLVMVLVIGVACFNIISTLMMTVKDRAPDIAILQTMGATRRTIRTIFVWNGVLAGVLGSIMGAIFGSILSYYLSDIMKGIEHLVGYKFLSGEIYFIDFLPSELRLSDLFLVAGTAILLSLIATLYPAERAARIQPARVLSGR